jgi:hypothetical protein
MIDLRSLDPDGGALIRTMAAAVLLQPVLIGRRRQVGAAPEEPMRQAAEQANGLSPGSHTSDFAISSVWRMPAPAAKTMVVPAPQGSRDMTDIRTRSGDVKAQPPSHPMFVLLLFSAIGLLASVVALLLDRGLFDQQFAYW